MDKLQHWRAQHTRLLLFRCEILVVESIFAFLSPEYYCSECLQILSCEEDIHELRSKVTSWNRTTSCPCTFKQRPLIEHNHILATDIVCQYFTETGKLYFSWDSLWWCRSSLNLYLLTLATFLGVDKNRILLLPLSTHRLQAFLD